MPILDLKNLKDELTSTIWLSAIKIAYEKTFPGGFPTGPKEFRQKPNFTINHSGKFFAFPRLNFPLSIIQAFNPVLITHKNNSRIIYPLLFCRASAVFSLFALFHLAYLFGPTSKTQTNRLFYYILFLWFPYFCLESLNNCEN